MDRRADSEGIYILSGGAKVFFFTLFNIDGAFPSFNPRDQLALAS